MTEKKIEIWVIDPIAKRRSLLASKLGEIGHPTYPMDTGDEFPETFGRAAVAMVYDDHDAVDRLLYYRSKQPVACVAYSESMKARRASELVRKGVSELLDWPCQLQEIVNAVSTAESDLSGLGANAWQGASARTRIESLSRREKEVLGWVISGKTSRQIAEALNLSLRTIEVHRFNCFRRLGVKNTAEAVRLGINSGQFKHTVEI